MIVYVIHVISVKVELSFKEAVPRAILSSRETATSLDMKSIVKSMFEACGCAKEKF